MGFGRAVILGAVLLWAAREVRAGAPSYSVDSIVNTATQTAGFLSPNGLATIYGSELAFGTNSVPAYSLTAGGLPMTLGGTSVVVGGFLAGLIYVSPTQINFVVPYELAQGTVTLFVGRDALAGPLIRIQLYAAAPAFFTWNGNYAIAAHLDGTIVGPANPARPGETILLFVTGLGRVWPDLSSGQISSLPRVLYPNAQLQVSLGGTPIPGPNILYAGTAPNYAGLYQINVRLPDPLPVSQALGVSAYGQSSPVPVILALQLPVAAPPVQAPN